MTQRAVLLPEPSQPPCAGPNPGQFQSGSYRLLIRGSRLLVVIGHGCRGIQGIRKRSNPIEKTPFHELYRLCGLSPGESDARQPQAFPFHHLSLPIMQHWYLYEIPLRKVLCIEPASRISRPTTGLSDYR